MTREQKQQLYYFGDIVVNKDMLVGVVIKVWINDRRGQYTYEVYMRSLNSIVEYKESDIQRYIMHKELSEDDEQWYGF